MRKWKGYPFVKWCLFSAPQVFPLQDYEAERGSSVTEAADRRVDQVKAPQTEVAERRMDQNQPAKTETSINSTTATNRWNSSIYTECFFVNKNTSSTTFRLLKDVYMWFLTVLPSIIVNNNRNGLWDINLLLTIVVSGLTTSLYTYLRADWIKKHNY